MISTRIRGQFKRNIISPLQPETAESDPPTTKGQPSQPVRQSVQGKEEQCSSGIEK